MIFKKINFHVFMLDLTIAPINDLLSTLQISNDNLFQKTLDQCLNFAAR